MYVDRENADDIAEETFQKGKIDFYNPPPTKTTHLRWGSPHHQHFSATEHIKNINNIIIYI